MEAACAGPAQAPLSAGNGQPGACPGPCSGRGRKQRTAGRPQPASPAAVQGCLRSAHVTSCRQPLLHLHRAPLTQQPMFSLPGRWAALLHGAPAADGRGATLFRCTLRIACAAGRAARVLGCPCAQAAAKHAQTCLSIGLLCAGSGVCQEVELVQPRWILQPSHTVRIMLSSPAQPVAGRSRLSPALASLYTHLHVRAIANLAQYGISPAGATHIHGLRRWLNANLQQLQLLTEHGESS